MDDRAPSENQDLHPDDASAVDRWVDGQADQASTSRDRALNDLLGLLSTPPAQHQTRAARISGVLDRLRPSEIELHPDTIEAIDGRMLGARPPASLQDQAQRLDQIGGLLTASTTPPGMDADARASRIESTLAMIEREASAQNSRMRLDPETQTSGGRGRLGWRDVVSVAAMLLIASAVIMPVMGSIRESSSRAVCSANLAGLSQAFGLYASEHEEELPMASPLDNGWLRVGQDPTRSNSANLFVLVRLNLASMEGLACPGNPEAPTALTTPGQLDWRAIDEISYSYRILPKGQTVNWNASGPASIVVADRSPIIRKVVRGESVRVDANSPNHQGEMQHFLTTNGSWDQSTTPVLGGDNIWLPGIIEDSMHEARVRMGLIKGNERPDAASDVFLAP